MADVKWTDLKVKQREHLWLACARGLNPAADTIDDDAIDALKAAGLIHKTTNRKGRVLWRPTDTGRGLVASRGLIPTFLHRRYSQSNYTHSYRHAMKGEPEVMDDAA
jgi:hypothetical protein